MCHLTHQQPVCHSAASECGCTASSPGHSARNAQSAGGAARGRTMRVSTVQKFVSLLIKSTPSSWVKVTRKNANCWLMVDAAWRHSRWVSVLYQNHCVGHPHGIAMALNNYCFWQQQKTKKLSSGFQLQRCHSWYDQLSLDHRCVVVKLRHTVRKPDINLDCSHDGTSSKLKAVGLTCKIWPSL